MSTMAILEGWIVVEWWQLPALLAVEAEQWSLPGCDSTRSVAPPLGLGHVALIHVSWLQSVQ